jgi:hypothetical protein
MTEHDREEVIALDTGLGIEWSPALVVVQVVSQRRRLERQQAFYPRIAEALERDSGIASANVIASVTENGDGEAQFVIGVLR